MVITVDTNFLIWGVRCVSTVGQEDMIVRAQAFFSWVDERRHELVLTSECVAEYLVGGTELERKEQLIELSSKFKICPFDAKAAVIAAELRSDREFINSLKDDAGKTRVCIKSDINIVATAKAHGVERVYSADRDLRKVAAKCQLSAMDIPRPTELDSSLPTEGRETQKSLQFPNDE